MTETIISDFFLSFNFIQTETFLNGCMLLCIKWTHFCFCFFSPSGGGTAKRPSAAVGTPPPAMTSGNESEAPTVTGSTPQNGENKPPQAIVKPQVLTHVIEGFVIQEGAEPFPVCVSAQSQQYWQTNMINNPKPAPSPVYTPAGNCQQANTYPLLLLAMTSYSFCLIHSLITGR